MRVLSLFSGAGFGELLLDELGIDVIVANEISEEVASLYKFYHPKVDMVVGNICDRNIKETIIEKAIYNKVNVLIGSLPCPKFCVSNNKNINGWLNIDRNNLLINTLDIIDRVKLEYILIETLPNIFNTHAGKEMMNFIIDKYKNIYNVELELINYSDCGVPQNKRRSFLKIYKKGFTWESILKPEKQITVKEAIGMLPSLEAGEKSNIKNHWARTIPKDRIDRIKNAPISNRELFYKNNSNSNNIQKYGYRRIEWDKPLPHITLLEYNRIIHPGRERKGMERSDSRLFTIRELLILSSIDGDLDIPDFISYGKFIKILSNSTSPLVMKRILEGINKSLDDNIYNTQNQTQKTENFFNTPKENSIIKMEIVSKYFKAWVTRMKNRVDRLAYIDLYSGPGVYDDGTEATPIKIIKHCIEDNVLSDKIELFFNDSKKEIYEKLKYNVDSIKNINKLKNKIHISNLEINSDFAKKINEKKLSTSFSFIDPFGYKGVSKELIIKLTEKFASDCLIFFNYTRINNGIFNSTVETEINSFFGEQCINSIREKINEAIDNTKKEDISSERETIIIDEFCDSLQNIGKYIIPFRFEYEDKNLTSHYLIFVTQNYASYKIMKDIMSKISSEKIEGVGSFSYISNRDTKYKNGYVYKYALSSMEELKELILAIEHKNKRYKVDKLCKRYATNTSFTEANVKRALIELENEKKILVIASAMHRRKNTMGDNNIVIFK